MNCSLPASCSFHVLWTRCSSWKCLSCCLPWQAPRGLGFQDKLAIAARRAKRDTVEDRAASWVWITMRPKIGQCVFPSALSSRSCRFNRSSPAQKAKRMKGNTGSRWLAKDGPAVYPLLKSRPSLLRRKTRSSRRLFKEEKRERESRRKEEFRQCMRTKALIFIFFFSLPSPFE